MMQFNMLIGIDCLSAYIGFCCTAKFCLTHHAKQRIGFTLLSHDVQCALLIVLLRWLASNDDHDNTVKYNIHLCTFHQSCMLQAG